MNIGLDNEVSREKLKSLKKDDKMYSAYYTEATKSVGCTEYTFIEYTKTPRDETTGIWAKMKSDEGRTLALDITKGVFLTKEDALLAFKEVIKTIYKATILALEKEE